MVGHKVHNNLQVVAVAIVNKFKELVHTLVNILCNIGVDIIVVGYGIRRASLALYNSRMLAWNAVRRIIGSSSMTYHSSIPHVCISLGTYLMENIIGKEIHLSTAVFGNRTILIAYIGTVAKKTCEDLVYYYLLIAHILFRGYHEH